MEDILKNSECFVLGKVIDSKSGSVKIKILKNFGAQKTPEEITLQGFHMLNICSRENENEAPTFYFHMIDTVYLFLKKKDIGYCIPTPTSGYAIVSNGKVLSTFRHSYHQAHLSMSNYEKSMVPIWCAYRGTEYDVKSANEFIDKQLSKAPAGFRDHEIQLFFLQHAALEMVFHMKLTSKYDLVKPFIRCSNNHLMISSVRCLSVLENQNCKAELWNYIKDDAQDNFTRVIAVWSLKRLKPVELKSEIEKVTESANETPLGFGGNIMDPRVCTHIPNLKDALKDLLSGL
jgi:hypothetical protein